MAGSALLRRYTVARGGDPAELASAVGRSFKVQVRPQGASSPGVVNEFRAVGGAQFTIGFIASDVAVHSEPVHKAYFVHLGLSGRVRIQRRGEHVTSTPMNVAVFSPGDPHVFVPDGRFETLIIRLGPDLVEGELAGLLGHPPDGPVRFAFGLDLAEPRTRGLRLMLDSLLEQWSSEEDLFGSPAVQLAQVRSLVTAMLLSHQHSFTDALATGYSPLRPRPLRLALEHIDAHLGEQLTLGDIATAAQCSARTVTRAFREHLDVTPMTYVLNRRLEHARAELAGGTETVSVVATRWGFSHLGRFALSYSERFGQLPSDTVRAR